MKKGVAEVSWTGSIQKTAKARGTVFDDGTITLKLEARAKTGAPVEATLTGKVLNAIITASGVWSSGVAVSVEWKRAP